MKALDADYAHQLLQNKNLDGQLISQQIGRDLISAGFHFTKPVDFHLTTSHWHDATQSIVGTKNAMQQHETAMLEYETAAAARLAFGLAYMDQAGLQPDEAPQRHRLVAAQRVLTAAIPEIIQAKQNADSLEGIFNNAANHNDGPALERSAKGIVKQIEEAVGRVLTLVGETAHPYADGHPPISSSLHQPDEQANDYGRAFQMTSTCVEALIPMHMRVMGDLCGLALMAEKQYLGGSAVPPTHPPQL
jgi:hypothetical protein